MKFLSNTSDPSRPDARHRFTYTLDSAESDQWQRYLEWLKDKTIGRPRATWAFSVEQLEAMGMVGVYDPSRPEDKEPSC